ncbi:MAG: murein L,D-transpeptidase catalytic domain family protein [Sphingobium sp.]|nr:murein L,D-transpeptidase catalytic domain family protein [Sphingobium sp.]
MDRRSFLKHTGAVAGAAILPATLAGRAMAAEMRPTVQDIPAVPPTLPPGALKASLAPLLDRARAALDANGAAVAQRDRVALADFSAPSSQYRFHIVDLQAGRAMSYLVAHGLGSDPDHSGFLQSFSNEPNSLATSQGAYVSGEVYDGVHGAAMRLVGLDPTNNNADMRAIVVHSAPYVSEDHVATWGKVGRSNGCFVVAPHLVTQVLGLLGPGRLLYAAKL